MKPSNQSISPIAWIIISAVGFILFLTAALALIFFSDRIGTIKPQIYFFLLVIIGLVCAAFLSGAMKSHAKYSGKVYGGTLELGGPVLILVLLVFLGFKFMPKKDVFTLKFTMYGSASKTAMVNAGQLKIFLGKPDSQRIENGYVSFTDIDTKYKGKKIDVLSVAPGFYNLSQNITVPDEDMPVELFMMLKADSVFINGMVINSKGQPVKNIVILFANGIAKDTSDSYGNFKVLLPLKEGSEINVRAYQQDALRYNSSQIISGSGTMTLQLQ